MIQQLTVADGLGRHARKLLLQAVGNLGGLFAQSWGGFHLALRCLTRQMPQAIQHWVIQRRVGVGEAALALPPQITPFSVVAFLRRIQQEFAAKLDETSRQSLQAQIREIENAFFSGGNVPSNAPNLEAVARKWHQSVA